MLAIAIDLMFSTVVKFRRLFVRAKLISRYPQKGNNLGVAVSHNDFRAIQYLEDRLRSINTQTLLQTPALYAIPRIAPGTRDNVS